MCLQGPETMDHILLGCLLSRQSRGLGQDFIPAGTDDFGCPWRCWYIPLVELVKAKGRALAGRGSTCWSCWFAGRSGRSATPGILGTRLPAHASLQILLEAALWVQAGFVSLLSLISVM